MRGINNIVEDNSANIINFINDISNNVPSQNILEFEANLVNNNFTDPQFGQSLYNQLVTDISNNIPNVFNSFRQKKYLIIIILLNILYPNIILTKHTSYVLCPFLVLL